MFQRVRLDDASPKDRQRYAPYMEQFGDRFRNGEYVDLDDLLRHFSRAQIEVSLLASQGYTWARSAVVQRTRSVEIGRFNPHGAEGHTGKLEIEVGGEQRQD